MPDLLQRVMYKLIIFDLDGTLAPMGEDTLYPDFITWREANPKQTYVVATNQGGIGLRYWMEAENFGDPSQYPTYEAFIERVNKLWPEIAFQPRIFMCARYQSKSSGKWCPVPEWGVGHSMWKPEWRKPAPGMLIEAMRQYDATPRETLMIGDSNEDVQAAFAAECAFGMADTFFGRGPF